MKEAAFLSRRGRLYIWSARTLFLDVRAERGRGKAVLVVEIHVWNVCPAVADGDRLGDAIGGDDHGLAFDLCLGRDEVFVLTGDGKAFQIAALRREPGSVLEFHDGLAPLDLQRVKLGAGILDLLTINFGPRGEGEPCADRL